MHYALLVSASGPSGLLKASPEGEGFCPSQSPRIENKYENVLEALKDHDHHKAETVLQLTFKEKQLERKLRDSHLTRLSEGGDETVKTSADHLAILAGLGAVGTKLDGVAEEILREM